jgi:UDP-N-acetylmuramate: L-alanyl-gamma-D-glutamyl-meso-diaminopimelate ligase
MQHRRRADLSESSAMNIYFLGIAGAGMSALASILVTEGHGVSGSDDGVFPPITTYLDRLGVPYHVGFDADLVPPGLDAAVVGSSAKLDLAHNPELAELKRRGTPLYSFPEFLGRHTAARDTVVVAGSFGKSSVTALLAVVLTESGRDPGYFIGAVPLDLPLTGRAGTDPIFVMEGDEYVVGPDDRRSKFALYAPKSLLITSLIHDHVNVFPTMTDYEAPFVQLIADLPPDAPLVCAHPFEALRRLADGRRVTWYGREPCPGYFAENLVVGETSRFDLVTPAGKRIPLETELLGLHNIENIVGAAALLLERGDVGAEALQRGVRRFRGVARRLDKKTTASRVPAYEGFGSSYEKARSAIEAILLHFPGRPCVVVFEPHTFSWRDPAALFWYDTVFADVGSVLLLPPPLHGAGEAQSSQAQIAGRIAEAGVPVTPVADGAAVLGELAATLTGEEVILLLSSGPLDRLPEALPTWLETRFAR